MPKTRFGHLENGVLITPTDFSIGDTVKVTYHGSLAKNSTNDVYAHVGFGKNDWRHVESVKMKKTKKGYETYIPVISTSNLNIVFKDDTDCWDNNDGKNYTASATPISADSKVYITPSEFSVGDTVKLVYKGTLYKDKSNHIYAHIGYGDNWTYTEDIKMKKTKTGFETQILINSTESLNAAFRNEDDDWDNNANTNYKLY